METLVLKIQAVKMNMNIYINVYIHIYVYVDTYIYMKSSKGDFN